MRGRGGWRKDPRNRNKPPPASPMEQAFEEIKARRPSIATIEENGDEDEWKIEGSGAGRGASQVMEQLYVARFDQGGEHLAETAEGGRIFTFRNDKSGGHHRASAMENYSRLHTVMTLNLLLDSRLAKLQRNGSDQKSHDFRIYFDPPILLDRDKDYAERLRWTGWSPWATRGSTSPRNTTTTSWDGARKVVLGKLWRSQTGCTITMRSIATPRLTLGSLTLTTKRKNMSSPSTSTSPSFGW